MNVKVLKIIIVYVEYCLYLNQEDWKSNKLVNVVGLKNLMRKFRVMPLIISSVTSHTIHQIYPNSQLK